MVMAMLDIQIRAIDAISNCRCCHNVRALDAIKYRSMEADLGYLRIDYTLDILANMSSSPSRSLLNQCF